MTQKLGKFFLVTLFLLFWFSGPGGSTRILGSTPRLQSDIQSLFTEDEKGIRFTLSPTPAQKQNLSSRLSLFWVDSSGKEIKYLGLLNDEGLFGDRKAGDGVYSRKVEFKQHRPRTLYFAWTHEDPAQPARLTRPISTDELIKIEVLQRPTFVEIVKRIWSRL